MLLLTSDGNEIKCVLTSDLCSDQEEADTKIILHCMQAGKACAQSTPIVVRSPDTDVLILLLSYASSISQPLYMDTGTSNKRRIINVKAIADVLGSDMCAALLAFHAFSGCDYTSAFVRKGKVKPLEIVRRNVDFILAFRRLGTAASFEEKHLSELERFVCAMYGWSTCKDTNALRYKLFQQRFDVTSKDKAFSVLDGVDLCLLPPCRTSLKLHSERSNYVAHIWRNAHVQYQNLPSPIGNGWIQADDGTVTIQWTQGDLLPQQLIDVMSTDSNGSSSASSQSDCVEEDTEQFEMVEEDF